MYFPIKRYKVSTTCKNYVQKNVGPTISCQQNTSDERLAVKFWKTFKNQHFYIDGYWYESDMLH